MSVYDEQRCSLFLTGNYTTIQALPSTVLAVYFEQLFLQPVDMLSCVLWGVYLVVCWGALCILLYKNDVQHIQDCFVHL